MVNIPVDVWSGTVNDHGISRKQFVSVPVMETVPDPDDPTKTIEVQKTDDEGNLLFEDHPVGVKPYDKETGEDVDRSQIVKKIATEYGFVYVEDQEIERLFEISPRSLRVIGFQPLHLFYRGNYVPKGLAFLEPSKLAVGKKKVPNKAAAKSLTMLLTAMREESALAVIEYTNRGTPQPAILLPDGTLWAVYFTEELREQRELPEVPVAENEVAMGRTFIKAMWTTDPMDLEDKRTALIQAFADEKAAAGDFGRPEVDEDVEEVQDEGTSDLAAALAASLAMLQAEQDAKKASNA
jgi:non-homologous end joining protein Ku